MVLNRIATMPVKLDAPFENICPYHSGYNFYYFEMECFKGDNSNHEDRKCEVKELDS